ncbi:MAG: TonB-dependent receptor, partial [Nevskiaceae bacterium]|jgi:outer membrane receptor protein involved in Fe transport|nr:TonB-dependent receptor [Nevskiaceae bacterium]
MDPQQHALTYARLNLHSDSRWTQDVTLTASWQQSLEGRNARRNGSAIQTREEDKINTLGFSADVFSRLNDYWTANSGIELYHDKVNSAKHDFDTATGVAGPAVRGLYPDDSRYGNYSLYTLSHFNFNQWVIDAGLRFNTFDIRIKDVTLGDVKITPSALVANAAVMYKILDNQSLYLSYSSGYRAPNVDDMGTLGIVDFRYEVPASNLKPEQSQNIEAGYKLQTGRVSLALAAYHMDLSNIITRVATGDQIDGYTVYRKENSQSSYIRGFEAEFSLAATENLNFSGGVAHAYGQNTSADEPMRRIPPFNGRLMSEYRTDKWFAAAEFRFASSQTRLAQGDIDDNRIGPNGTAAWQVVNLYAGYRFSQLHINASLQNIFDEDYRMHGSGINGVGASAWIEASMEF